MDDKNFMGFIETMDLCIRLFSLRWIEFKDKIIFNVKNNPEWRKGQTVFNSLYEIDPETADKLRTTDVDCFYQDKNIEQFIMMTFILWFEKMKGE